jgi:hypothetical protein
MFCKPFEENGMAFKEVTAGNEIYWINTDQIAYIRKVPEGSVIQFNAVADKQTISLTVKESPEQILGSGHVRSFS